MRERASSTAAWVAYARGLGRRLPAEAQLIHDPLGEAFAGAARRALVVLGGPIAWRAIRPLVLYMQVRTRVIDDAVRAFLQNGGRQVVLLGAGYDCRALRLGGARFFEVDHPATQSEKRAVLARAGAPASDVCYVPFDFEARSVSELAAALAELGHDPRSPTLTIWEGVTMYLSEAAIASSVASLASWSAPDSKLVVTYLHAAELEAGSNTRRWLGKVVASMGEPFTFGWDPAHFAAWFGARGFTVDLNKSSLEWASALLPAGYPAEIARSRNFIAELTRA